MQSRKQRLVAEGAREQGLVVIKDAKVHAKKGSPEDKDDDEYCRQLKFIKPDWNRIDLNRLNAIRIKQEQINKLQHEIAVISIDLSLLK